MTLYVDKTLEDGATVVKDNQDAGFAVVLKPGQFEYAMGQPDPKATALQFERENGAEWKRERGPDSELGKQASMGIPTTDRSSESTEQPHGTDAGFSGQQPVRE